jgi:hypothetical protein
MLKDKIQEDLKASMFARDELKTSTLRLLLSSLKNYEIEKGLNYEANDEDVLTIIGREIKKRREAVDAYTQAGREESAQKEQSELDILGAYQPEQMGEDEIRTIVKNAIEQTGATSMQDMGKLMGVIMPQVKGKADGNLVNKIVRENLV